ncbi:hypothetical protein M2421_003999 [Stenotrophomonas sp. BIGb0135]|nr:hypothetical protein [Stenotrophomonas sp. BIGb0135]
MDKLTAIDEPQITPKKSTNLFRFISSLMIGPPLVRPHELQGA